MSEGLRNDGRIWVPKNKNDDRPPSEIPEHERDYYLERLHPNFGNLVPRDIASREALAICQAGFGVGPTKRAVYLDFKERPRELLKNRYGNLFDMYEEITGEDPYSVPMRIFPAAHFSMGGLWVDYHLRTNLPGLFALGEANYADHGANRLGANSLLQTLVDGLFVAPLTIADELAHQEPLKVPESVERDARSQAERETLAFINSDGTRTPRDFHRELGSVLRDLVGTKRDGRGLAEASQTIRQLRSEFESCVKVVGDRKTLNQQLEKAGRTRDFLELAELMAKDALYREECCGSHFRSDLPAARDDQKFAHVAAWEWTGDPAEAKLHREELRFETVQPSERVY